MWYKRTVLFWTVCILLIDLWGCAAVQDGENRENQLLRLAEGYRDIYEEAEKTDQLENRKIQEQILQRLGEAGYAAVDFQSQINMTHYEQVDTFCRKAEKGKKGRTCLLSLLNNGGFVCYDLTAAEGEMEVELRTVTWNQAEPEISYYQKFQAYSWKYTDGGYLFLEEYQPEGYDSAPGRIGFRVRPLAERCREMNRRYVYPLGYDRNNLLLTDWNENDLGDLELYDLYERFYQMEYGTYVPYQKDYEMVECEIPQEEFEQILHLHLGISSEVIRNHTVYNAETQMYRYRYGGVHEYEVPYGPYPEVTEVEEQEDGTVLLTVQGVFERKGLDQAVTSKLIVRPLEDGGFQYVSNQVVSYDERLDIQLYRPRLTDEEWEQYAQDMGGKHMALKKSENISESMGSKTGFLAWVNVCKY